MKKVNTWILKYLKWASPVALLAVILSMTGNSGYTLQHDIIGLATILWIVFLVYMVFMAAFNSLVRDTFVRKLSGIKENDEREAQITGLVSKKTFIFMTGILTLLLFLSIIQIDVLRYSHSSENGKKHWSVQLGMGMQFIESHEKKTEITDEFTREYLIKYEGLPLTSGGTLVVVMLLQLGAFYFFSRNENRLV